MNKKKVSQGFFRSNETAGIYFDNKEFEDFIFQKQYYPYQFDLWKDRTKYGLVYNGVEVSPKNSCLKFIEGANNSGHKVIAFVADAFLELKNYYQQFIRSNKLNNNGSIYGRLDVVGAHKDLNDAYIDYINFVYSIFSRTFLTNNVIKNISSLDDFLKVFVTFCEAIKTPFIFSRSAFISNNLCPLETNGLTISFANDVETSNAQKKETYFNNENFEIFFQSTKRFGFMIDRNAPWRIVADIESPVMLEYASAYGLKNTADIFENFYHKAYLSDIDSNKNVLVSFWNRFVSENSLIFKNTEIINCKNLFSSREQLKQISVEVFEKYYNINWQLRFLLFIKINENSIKISQNIFENLFLEITKINNYYGLEESLKFIDDKILEFELAQTKKINNLTSLDTLAKLAENFKATASSERIIF